MLTSLQSSRARMCWVGDASVRDACRALHLLFRHQGLIIAAHSGYLISKCENTVLAPGSPEGFDRRMRNAADRYRLLGHMNARTGWRKLLGSVTPKLHLSSPLLQGWTCPRPTCRPAGMVRGGWAKH